jgi:polar amino acid transport system permease protein
VTYQWSFGFLWEYRTIIAQGLLITILFTIGTNLAGLAIGLVVGLARLLMPTIVQLPLIAYIELFRCTPLLVQLVWIYYALPVLIGVNIPAYTAGALALSLYAGSFYAEIFRGGVSAIDRGQWDAARAVGMRQGHVLRRVVLPQAFRLTIPPIINQTVLQLKEHIAYLDACGRRSALSGLDHHSSDLPAARGLHDGCRSLLRGSLSDDAARQVR